MRESRIPWSVAVAVIGGLTLIACCIILSNTLVRIRSQDEIIRVTGSARKPIRSDFILWKGRISLNAPTMEQAYRELKTAMQKTQTYLLAQGIAPAEILVNAIQTETLYAPIKRDPKLPPENYENLLRPVVGYQLTQEIEVRSDKVDLVGEVSRRSTELISSGVPFESQPPEYIYTKLSDMKIAMLAEAAKDARARADQIALNAGCRVGEVRFARMGVLQITPIYSTAVSSEGINDTSSLDKAITAIVTMGFSIR
jgi:hypothetical protein